jgi:hypothetical protein
MVYVVDIAVAAEARGGHVAEDGNIVTYVGPGPGREEMDVRTNEKGDAKGEYGGHGGTIGHPVISGVGHCH